MAPKVESKKRGEKSTVEQTDQDPVTFSTVYYRERSLGPSCNLEEMVVEVFSTKVEPVEVTSGSFDYEGTLFND